MWWNGWRELLRYGILSQERVYWRSKYVETEIYQLKEFRRLKSGFDEWGNKDFYFEIYKRYKTEVLTTVVLHNYLFSFLMTKKSLLWYQFVFHAIHVLLCSINLVLILSSHIVTFSLWQSVPKLVLQGLQWCHHCHCVYSPGCSSSLSFYLSQN